MLQSRRMKDVTSMVVSRVTLTLHSGGFSDVPGFWGRLTAVDKAGSDIKGAVGWGVGEERALSSGPWKRFQ